MVVKTDAIMERLRALDEYIRLLQPYRAWDIRRLVEDRITYGGVLHYLQAPLSGGMAGCASSRSRGRACLLLSLVREEMIKPMGQHRILPYDFAQRIAPMAGFRMIGGNT